MKNLDFIVKIVRGPKIATITVEKKNTYMKSEGQQIRAD